ELFGELAARATDAEARARLEELLRRAQAAAAGTRPRLDPAALEALLRVARAAAELDQAAPSPGALSAEALVVACMLIFVSEEERYPRPRYRGSDVALE